MKLTLPTVLAIIIVVAVVLLVSMWFYGWGLFPHTSALRL